MKGKCPFRIAVLKVGRKHVKYCRCDLPFGHWGSHATVLHGKVVHFGWNEAPKCG